MAWQVDPALALSLQDHFPANSDVKHALEALVVEHAHAAKVRAAKALLACLAHSSSWNPFDCVLGPSLAGMLLLSRHWAQPMCAGRKNKYVCACMA